MSRLAVALSLLFAAACSSRPSVSQQTPPPVVAFQAPVDGSYLHGSVAITATAQGTVKIKTFTFTAPTGLAGTVAALDPNNRAAQLQVNLDLSTYADGPLKVTVTAEDEAGMKATKDLTINVAAKAPTITIEAPPAGGVIRGAAIAISARAAAQAGATITTLQLLDPPLGMGTNTSATSSQWAATWNSTASLEGPVTLHFRATDSTGLVGDASVGVTVDNVPLGQLDAYVFAGAPIPDAYVEVWALSNATASVDLTAGTNGLLGRAGPTDNVGHILVTLSAENYSGPVQLRAVPAPGTTLSYLDPTTPTPTSVQLPANVTLSSLLPAYTTGQAVTAPITLTTSLADAAALAYAAGHHRLHATTHTVSDAVAYIDPLIVQHDQPTTPRWSLRATRPADLTGTPLTLGDRAYAAFMDVALNQLATDLSGDAGVAGVITAPTLLAKLEADLEADGQLDGLGVSGSVLNTGIGSPPYSLDANTLRNRLATSLDRWIVGSRNTSGLTRTTLFGAGVYNQLATDASELFGVQAPVPFDNTAPALSVAITYGPSNLPPFGGNYVSGTTKIIITANDTARVQSLTAMLGNLSLDSSAAITRSADRRTLTYTVSVDTRTLADLTYSLSVTASDEQTNTATSTPATITVDNTSPTVATAQPSGSAAYSGNVPFDGTASDGVGAGIASFTTSGFTGLTDGDTTTTHFFGTWTIPAGVVDGRVSGGWIACDNVGNCSTSTTTPVQLTVDRSAPTVAFTSKPSLASNTASAAFTGTVTDTTGVSAVWLALNGEPPVHATLSGSTWSYSYPTVRRGPNTVVVWADDTALPTPNSGNNPATLNQISYDFFRDDVAPAPTYVASLASYYDERNLVAQASGGQAVVPAVYTYASASKVAIPASGGHVYRTATRLSWASAPTAAELEGTNVNNVPILQFSVPYDAAVDSPITSITATVTYGCATCLIPNDTNVTLWTSPTAAVNALLFDLPLAANVLPGLASVTTATTLTVTITATDAAGNAVPVQLVTLTFHPIGGALVISTDAAYAASNNLGSTYPYVIRNVKPDYRDIFSSGTTWPDNVVRIQRYIVTNPTPYPVAFSTTGLPANWSMLETWGAAVSGATTSARICDAWPGPSDTGAPNGLSNTAATAAVRTLAFKLQGAVETGAADRTSSQDIIVPAASGTTPGAIAFYVAHDRVIARSGPTMTWNAANNRFDGAAAPPHQIVSNLGTPKCCEPLEGGICYAPGVDATVTTTPYVYYLDGARDLAGTAFTVTTYGGTPTIPTSPRTSEGNSFTATTVVPQPGH